MARDMGGGMQVYVMRPGLRGRREDLVGTLDDALPDQLATVGEQRAFAEAWRAEEASNDERARHSPALGRKATTAEADSASSPADLHAFDAGARRSRRTGCSAASGSLR
jgi:hypothetical protein